MALCEGKITFVFRLLLLCMESMSFILPNDSITFSDSMGGGSKAAVLSDSHFSTPNENCSQPWTWTSSFFFKNAATLFSPEMLQAFSAPMTKNAR